MANWTVRYRRADGEVGTEVVSAESRAAALAQMKDRGITAISITSARGGQAAGVSGHSRLPVPCRWLAAVILVVSIVAAVLFFVGRGTTPAKSPKRGPEPRKLRTPPPPRPKPRTAEKTNEVVEAEAPLPKPVEPPPRSTGRQKVGEIRDGKILLPSGRLHVVRGITTNNFHEATRGAYEIFDHHTDNMIASVLTLKPGEGMVGTMRFNGRFKADFLESLKHPIEIAPDDSEEARALKQSVIETRAELKAAFDRGEDIEQIMQESRQEAQRLSIYRAQIKEEIDRYVKEHASGAQEMEDMVAAANRMLEEHGVAPIKYGPLVRQKMLMMRKEAKKGTAK